MNMWNHLPLGEMHTTTNYGCAGGVCEGRYANIYHAQLLRRKKQIEHQLAELKKDDPTMYYRADFDDLLDAHRLLTERLNGPLA